MRQTATRVERRSDGWYDTQQERDVPMLQDVYWAGGFVDHLRDLRRRVEDLERRGA